MGLNNDADCDVKCETPKRFQLLVQQHCARCTFMNISDVVAATRRRHHGRHIAFKLRVFVLENFRHGAG